jgi:2'-5' RNA ligase
MTVYKKTTSCNVYNIMLMLPKEVTAIMNKITKKLKGLYSWQQNSKTPHISIKYLGLHKNYSKKYIIKLLPEIKEISKKILPIKLNIKGIKINEVPKSDKLDVFILIKKDKKIQALHNQIKNKLRSRIDHFSDWEGKNFLPHITVLSANKIHIKEIKRKIKILKINIKPIIAKKIALHIKKKIIYII